jgi:lecithin-cholesterol acyltransferase
MHSDRATFVFISFFVAVNQLSWILPAEAKPPVVFFPGYGLSVMQVTVEGQTAYPSCPASGNYSLHYQAASSQNGFDITCMTQLLTLSYNNITGAFSNVPGVTPILQDFGSVACAPFYEPFFNALRDDGWTDNVDLFGGCYDWRMAPNVNAIAGSNFVANMTTLVTNAYQNNNNQKVYLIGHSNGPIMIQYLLDVWTQSFKDTYIGTFFFFPCRPPIDLLM